MLVPAVTFYSVVLAIHIAAVVVAFGVTFAYPVMYALAGRDRRLLPLAYRIEHAVSRRLVQPGLLVVVVAGIYLASKSHTWSEFWVQWALGAAIAIGALAGGFLAPRERRLIEIADRDVAAAGPDGEVRMSAEHDALARQVSIAGGLASLLVLATIFVMTVKPG